MGLSSPRIALVDADLWSYDCAFAAQRKLEDGEIDILPFTYAQNIVDERLTSILNKTGCTEYEFYLTGRNNFRFDVATIAPYKGNRKQPRPYHYANLRSYLEFQYGAVVVDGIEADDILAIRQTEEGDNSCIVSRDKDLRMVKGWHYGYPVGNQLEQPLEHVDSLGYIRLNRKGKLKGAGMRWFFAQCLMGDRTDNIVGVPRLADIKAFNILKECTNETELYEKTIEAYTNYYDDEETAYDAFCENATLLWMITERNEDGSYKMWEDRWKN